MLTSGNSGAVGYDSGWAVNQAEYEAARPLTPISPEITIAIRNDPYKLVQSTTQAYDPVADTSGPVASEEFYLLSWTGRNMSRRPPSRNALQRVVEQVGQQSAM
ncbi:MAG: hypothetical protein ABI277_02835 [Burkholderiaceae bacterium]